MTVTVTCGIEDTLRVALDMDRVDIIGGDIVVVCANTLLSKGVKMTKFAYYLTHNGFDSSTIERLDKAVRTACDCQITECELDEEVTSVKRVTSLLSAECNLVGIGSGVSISGYGDENMFKRKETTQARNGDHVIGLTSPRINNIDELSIMMDATGVTWQDKPPWSLSPDCDSVFESVYERIPYYSALIPFIANGSVERMIYVQQNCLSDIGDVIPDESTLNLSPLLWKWTSVHEFMASIGGNKKDMVRTSNCGLGMVCVIKESRVKYVMSLLTNCYLLGVIHPRQQKLVF